MGSSISKSKEEKPLMAKKKSDERHYNFPDAREHVRYEPEETANHTSQYSASIDKFEYLIVFPLTESRGPFQVWYPFCCLLSALHIYCPHQYCPALALFLSCLPL